jgi:glycosyltransferase involved in cell wall biosynthesis
MQKKLISIVIAAFNEEENIKKLYLAISEQIKKINKTIDIDFEIIFIDNDSSDNSQEVIKLICKDDINVKAIFNLKNYGHIRSPYHGILQARGDAIILIAADFQDPVDLLPELVFNWIDGSKIVLLQRVSSDNSYFLEKTKSIYYKVLNLLSENPLLERVTGAGIYDKSVIDQLKKLKDPYPYFRGLLSELFGKIETIKFNQPKRKFGITSNNFYTLYDMGMLALTKHSKKFLRIITIFGFLISFLSFLAGLFFLFYKLLYWDEFSVGVAPIILGVLFGFSFQIFMIGIVGEYVGIILDHARKLPHVIEKERINFN